MDLPLVDIYAAGMDGVHTYRIPALAITNAGTLLAFAEARRDGAGDAGDIDLVVRRSTDDGDTWGEVTTVWDDGANTCGNPTPVVDRATGRILLPMTWNRGADAERDIIAGRSNAPRRAFLAYSDDDGRSWSPARELANVRKPHWGWYATGPGNAIQLSRGTHAGRIVVPANHSDTTSQGHFYRAHVFYSDDGGASWTLGGTAGAATNESAVVELADGSLMLNMRSYAGRHRRAVSVSRDGGASWTPPVLDETLVEPVCQASMVRQRFAVGTLPGRILFANPASERRRERLTLRVSEDDGRTWLRHRTIDPGSSAYSSMAALADGRIGILFERDGYSRISLARLHSDKEAAD